MRIGSGDSGPEKERSSLVGPDLDHDAWFDLPRASEKPEDLFIGLPRPHVLLSPVVGAREGESLLVGHGRQPLEGPAGTEGVGVGPEPIEDHDGIGTRARIAAAARTRRIRAPERYLGYIVSTLRILPL